MNEVTFDQAKNYVLKFGPPHIRGKTLDEIAKTNKGLRFLDGLVDRSFLTEYTNSYIRAYLSEPGIKRDLENLI